MGGGEVQKGGVEHLVRSIAQVPTPPPLTMAVSPSSTKSKLHVSVAPSKSGAKGGTLSRSRSQSRPRKKGCLRKSAAPFRPSRTSGGHSSRRMRSRASSGTPESSRGTHRCSCSVERERYWPGGGRGAKGGAGVPSPCSARSCRRSRPSSRRRRASGRRTFRRRTRPVPTSRTRARSCPGRGPRPRPEGSRGTSSLGCPQPPVTAPEPNGPELGSAPPIVLWPRPIA